MRISIAMATYNGARFLESQLQSFVDQNRPPDELVICDDGSTDDTLAIADRFRTSAPFDVRVERNPENLGYSANFAKALSLCTGDFLFFSDQDDVWFETKLEKCSSVLGGRTAVVIGDCAIVDEEGEAWGTKLANIRSLGLPDLEMAAGCCTGMTRAFADFIQPFPDGVIYDNWVARMANLLGVRTVIDEPLQLYRRHELNASASLYSLRNPGTVDVLRRHGLKDVRQGWDAEIDFLDICRRRIIEGRTVAEAIAGSEGVASALATIEQKQRLLRQRMALLGRNRIVRAPEIYRLWRTGFYSGFAGWRSAAKDLIRP